MKKLHVLIMALGFIATTSASAQTKIAYVRIDDIVSVMPELAPEKVDMDTIGAKFIQDSIMPTVNYKQEQYNQKIKDYSDTTKKLSDQIKKLMLKEIQDLQTELGGVDQYLQQVQQ
ncbi:MAG TPA: hypothetical protein PLR98_08765, partial [Chitinophagaceae bacterium]|nr:hypothetical protein [Chitinophagaceae bacterium]